MEQPVEHLNYTKRNKHYGFDCHQIETKINNLQQKPHLLIKKPEDSHEMIEMETRAVEDAFLEGQDIAVSDGSFTSHLYGPYFKILDHGLYPGSISASNRCAGNLGKYKKY